MQARALVCRAEQTFEMADVVLPEAGDEDIVVRTTFSGISVGTGLALARNKVSWGPFPISLGYQAVGVVEHVGKAIDGIAAGRKVYYRNLKAMSLADGTPVTPTCGTHCSMAVVAASATHGPAVLPEGVDEAAASLFVMPAVGLHGVDMANPRAGQTVVVFGVGLIGLGVVAACVHRGCDVIAIDLNDRRLEMACQFGAGVTIRGDVDDLTGAVGAVAPTGADVVFECTGAPECITPAANLTRLYGTFVYQGNYGARPIAWDFIGKHGLQLTTLFPCDDGYGPCRRAVLRNMASGALPWERTLTHRVPPTEAAAFYERLNGGDDADVLGAVIQWS